MIAIVIPEIPRVVRLVRSIVLSIREEPYVEAAISLGTPTPTLLVRHVLPNTVAPLIVQGTFICASAILIEAILSFLGVGIPPETPTWGNIMAEGRALFRIYPAQHLLPGHLPGVRRCSPSTCWATACATRSTRASPSGCEADGRHHAPSSTVDGPHGRAAARVGPRRMPSRTSRFIGRRAARSSAWWANRARASRSSRRR